MKKLFFILLMTVASLMANDTQVFTSNSKHLKLDKNSKITKVFFGTEESYVKQTKAFNKAGSSIIKGFLEVGGAGGSGAAGAGVGAIGVIATALITKGYNSIVADNNYILLSEATDSKGNKTLLKTLVISNDKISLTEAEKLAVKAQNNLKK